MASLFVIQGRDRGKRFELSARISTIGRDSANPVQLTDNEVSRKHAEVHLNDGNYSLVDLESCNGSFINSNQVREQELKNGDRVQFGRTVMIFTLDDANESYLASQVDIVGQERREERSRIVRSMSQEESQIFSGDSLESLDSSLLSSNSRNLQVIYRTALAISHTLDIDQLLHRILELIFEWLETDRGCVLLADEESGHLTPRVQRNRDPNKQDERMLISRTILDYVLDHEQGVLTSDAREDERFEAAASIVTMGINEAICVPMRGRYGVVGAIYIDTYIPPGQAVMASTRRFNDEHLKLMIAIAHQAALAVEDTSYYSALVQSERLAAMGQTIALLSHHIKNILQGIRGGSYLIEEGLKASETEIIRKGWNIVDKNQEKISNLVMDMLTFSKEREPELVPNDLNTVVDDVVELMQSRAKEAGVTLNWRPDAGLPVLTFDADALHRAILNVVTNAIDACDKLKDGQVTVSTVYEASAAQAKVLVADNGEGIPDEDLHRIFSVFESKKGSRGTGLGLPVSQKIMKEHGGHISVQSEPNQGSCFILALPVASPASGLNAPTGFHPPMP